MNNFIKNFRGLAIIGIAAASFLFTSCDKLLVFEPGEVILAEDAINTTDDLQRLLVSTYDVLGNLYDGRVQIINELRGDNLAEPDNNNDYKAVYNRETTFFTGINGGVYTDFYYAIYRSNVVLESFNLVENISTEDKLRISAEARFVRAICHLGAVKIFAQPYGFTPDNSHSGIPLRLAPSQEPLPRATVGEVYAAIIDDLLFAAQNLPSSNGPYATSDAANGYLAHIYFLMQDWSTTVNYCDAIISSGRYTLDTDLNRFVYGIMNSETIFGINSYMDGISIPNSTFIDFRCESFRDNYRSDNNPTPQLTFSSDFVNWWNGLGEGSGDQRGDWFTVGERNFCNRFNGLDVFNIPLVHLTGIMLIRAEALAELNTDLSSAIDDINTIRNRAGASLLNESANASLVRDAARIDYRKETLCEGTWVEQLQRRGTMGEDITIRGGAWDCPGMALQFSNTENTVAGFELNPEGGCL
ncbi:MAG: hypothetical protein COA49_05195 [Bacteroidetes bacterium]|nr:MAG: hypothetical protein COA49_05195 [Bacteroidota bacterium]